MPPDAATAAKVGRRLLRRSRDAVSRWLRPALDPTAPTGLLTGAQLATLRAFAELVVAGTPLSDHDWEPIRRFLIDEARARPGYRTLCVAACRLLDRIAGGRFADAPLARRWAWIDAERLAVRPVARHELLNWGRRVHHAVREILVPDLVYAYFESPAGWALVGYDVVLGECRDPFAYTSRPS